MQSDKTVATVGGDGTARTRHQPMWLSYNPASPASSINAQTPILLYVTCHQLPLEPGLTATGLSGANTLSTLKSRDMLPEWSQGPLSGFSLLWLPAESGLVFPLRVPLATNGISICGDSSCDFRVRRSIDFRGVAWAEEEDPGIGWWMGCGREGSICFGLYRGGVGPATRRSAEGGGRRGIV